MTSEAFRDFEHNFWNVTAAPYDSGIGQVTAQSVEYILNGLNLKPGATLLDIACGPGYVTRAAQAKKIKTTGIDFSAAMIDLAKTLYPGAAFETADAEDLPFKDETFDAACCNFGVLHFPNPGKAMLEARRVLKPGARYIFTVWNLSEKFSAMSFLMDVVRKHAAPGAPLPEGLPYFHFAAEENSFPALKKAGFKNLSRREIDLIWPIRSAKSFVRSFHDGGARAGAILRAQTPETIQKITSDIAAGIAPYKSGAGYDVPVSIVLTCGEK